VSDFLTEKHKEITRRVKELEQELEPLVTEYNHLKDAASALAKVIGSTASDATSAVAATVTHRRRRGRPRGSGGKTATAATAPPAKRRGRPPAGRKKVGRPPRTATKAATSTAAPTAGPRRAGRRKGGKRARQAQALIRANPGITVSEMAKKMGINGTYLYTVLPPLEQAGKIRKDGRGWYSPEG
jgi:hypothetical protein